jgi:Uncharacterized protein conserved in bacteria
MSDTFYSDTWPPEDNDDLLAAEYVLGVLPAPERQAVARRAELDGALQTRIAAWEGRLALLNAAYEDGPVPETLYPRIEAALFGDRPAPARRGLGWLWITGTLVAAVLALAVLIWPQPEPAALLARLDGGALVFEARFDGTNLQIDRSGPVAEAGQDYQLWAIGSDGVPHSLGLLRGDSQSLAADLAEGVTLAVSLEPEGGSPGELPTGPVLAAAPLTSL